MRATRMSLAFLALSAAGPARAQVAIALDAAAEVRPIDPHIYGVNFASEAAAQFAELRYPADRWGGNSTTRYNWKLNSANSAADWYFLSINGARHQDELDAAAANGSDALVTIPMIGWVSNVAGTKACSFPEDAFPGQDAYGDQDSRGKRCGNGKKGGVAIVLDDAGKARANVQVDPQFVKDWIAQIRASWPAVHSYALDNEPILWSSTHFDVRGSAGAIRQLTAAQLWTLTVAYATAIREADPQARIYGPVLWGWCAYFAGDGSSADLGGCDPSRWDFVGWYLDQVAAYQKANGVKLIDYLDLHYYPQSGEYSGDESQAALRLQSIRELWDPTYVSQSWIAQAPRLIPRMRDWVAGHAPGLGLKISLSEYNWGDVDGISAALAQAEILSIFGRQGLDAGYRWVHPGANQPMLTDAFRMYLDYDGAGGRVLGDSIRSSSSSVDVVAGYGVVAADKLFVALFNKSASGQEVTVALLNASLTGAAGDLYGFAQTVRWGRVGAAAPSTTSQLTVSMPARSARLAVLPLARAPNPCNGDGVCEAGENPVNCPVDCSGGGGDGGAPDASPAGDGGAVDGGAGPDGGALDAGGGADAGPRDAGGGADAGARDGGGGADAGAPDSGGGDAGVRDASSADGGARDASAGDDAGADGALTDAARSGAGPPDAEVGAAGGASPFGCSCGAGGAAAAYGLAPWLVALYPRRRRRAGRQPSAGRAGAPD